MIYNRFNYYRGTFATFRECKVPKRKPDFTSESGSMYWYGKDKRGYFVIRASDHWCWHYYNNLMPGHWQDEERGSRTIASCFWNIRRNRPIEEKKIPHFRSLKAGKAYFSNFKPIYSDLR